MITVPAGNLEVEIHRTKLRWSTGILQSKTVDYDAITRILYTSNAATIFTNDGEQHHFSFSSPDEMEQFRWEAARNAINGAH